MEIVDYLLARKKAGGGSDVTIEQLSVTENGTYSEQGIAYSPVVVNVPAPENSYQLTDIPTGTVSTIEDGTDLPMPSLKVGIEPVQDLHGYDHPWAGGAGKNLLEVNTTTQTLNGVTFTVNTDGTINISGTATTDTLFALNTVTLPEGNYIVSGGIDGNCYINVTGKANSYGADNSFSVASGGETLSVRLYIVSGTATSGTFKPMIRLATETDATFAPYSNICPISGWTEANVTRSGKNLWNTDDVTSIFVGTITRNGLYFRKPGQYTVSAQNSGNYLYCRIFNADGTIKETYNIVSMLTITNATFAISDGEYFAVYDAIESSINVSKERFNSWLCQVEFGSTATTYEPYNGQTYTIQFKDGDNPLTVYGGTLDVTAGELVVDRASVDLGTLDWTYVLAQTRFYTQFNCKGSKDNNTVGNIICSTYMSDTYNNVVGGVNDASIAIPQNGDILTVRDSRYTDATDFKTAMNGVQLVYELVTPTTYHLTPTQVRTLVGNNNIWADTGDIIEGKYFKEL